LQLCSTFIILFFFFFFIFFFFFSSRRRHTRCLSDWSSDVCSSDLSNIVIPRHLSTILHHKSELLRGDLMETSRISIRDCYGERRSEERRVGKECRYRRGRE